MSLVNGLQINPVINSIKDNFWHSAGGTVYTMQITVLPFSRNNMPFRRDALQECCSVPLHLHNCDLRNFPRDLSELTPASIKPVSLLSHTSYTELSYLHNNDVLRGCLLDQS